MKRYLTLQTWNIAALFIGLGVSAVLFAWTSFNLFGVAIANFKLIKQYGLMALWDGGFQQFVEISFDALVSMLLFLMFKGCETEIVKRWRDWHDGAKPDDEVDI
jgi:putative effector of murein hydrolase LrgA (UPF0299 family)